MQYVFSCTNTTTPHAIQYTHSRVRAPSDKVLQDHLACARLAGTLLYPLALLSTFRAAVFSRLVCPAWWCSRSRCSNGCGCTSSRWSSLSRKLRKRSTGSGSSSSSRSARGSDPPADLEELPQLDLVGLVLSLLYKFSPVLSLYIHNSVKTVSTNITWRGTQDGKKRQH